MAESRSNGEGPVRGGAVGEGGGEDGGGADRGGEEGRAAVFTGGAA